MKDKRMKDKRHKPTDLETAVRHICASDAKAILLSGISGSGKTHLARMLEQEGFVRISVDALLMEKYGREFQALDSASQRRLTAEAEAEIAETMQHEIGNGNRVVVDSCLCKRAKRDFMRQKARETGFEPMLVYMEASLDKCLHRLETRNGADSDDIPVSEDMLRGFFSGFERPDTDETPVTILN